MQRLYCPTTKHTTAEFYRLAAGLGFVPGRFQEASEDAII